MDMETYGSLKLQLFGIKGALLAAMQVYGQIIIGPKG